MEKYNSTLRSMQGYILEGKKFVELPKKEMGRGGWGRTPVTYAANSCFY